MQTVTDSTRGV